MKYWTKKEEKELKNYCDSSGWAGKTSDEVEEEIRDKFGRSSNAAYAKAREKGWEFHKAGIDGKSKLTGEELEHFQTLVDQEFDNRYIQKDMKLRFEVTLPKSYISDKRFHLVRGEYPVVNNPDGDGHILERRYNLGEAVKQSIDGDTLMNTSIFDATNTDPDNLFQTGGRGQQLKFSRLFETERALGLTRREMVSTIPQEALQNKTLEHCLRVGFQNLGLNVTAQALSSESIKDQENIHGKAQA